MDEQSKTFLEKSHIEVGVSIAEHRKGLLVPFMGLAGQSSHLLLVLVALFDILPLHLLYLLAAFSLHR